MNLSPVCNKSTGECYCNAKHYRKIVSYTFSGAPLFSDGCFRCDCEEIGSTCDQCAAENGQCPCLKGRRGGKNVVGRRCNQCEDKQGQIVSGGGCVVINTSCPRAFAEEICWKKAAFGTTAKEKCPFGSSVKKFDVWNVDWKPDFALGIYIGQQLDLAITLSPQLYARDIEIALTI
ncbi:unnamed protein product, partial [Pocillopora meandrina]